MAKDGDIVDVLLGTIVDLFVWVVTGIFKLAFAVIGGLFTFIIGLFKKDTDAA